MAGPSYADLRLKPSLQRSTSDGFDDGGWQVTAAPQTLRLRIWWAATPAHEPRTVHAMILGTPRFHCRPADRGPRPLTDSPSMLLTADSGSPDATRT
jgi:hypothetical protein